MVTQRPDRITERILITSWLEPELVERIRAVSPSVEVLHFPELLTPPRYPGDHGSELPKLVRSKEEEERWAALLGTATVLFDIDRNHAEELPDLALNVRWVQSTSAGIGQTVKVHRYPERMPNTIFTTASGVHAVPLAEFAAMAMLMHSRRALHMVREQANRHWERFSGTDLLGRTIVVVGLGSVGSAAARMAKALRMRVLGIRRDPGKGSPGVEVDAVRGLDSLAELLPEAEYLVLAAPHTDETEGLIGAKELTLLPRGAALINIARGSLVDEQALVEALESGHLGGAYLDVFAREPLPAESPFWGMPNVLVYAHSASTSDRENGRIVDLFCENLRRYLDKRPLLNVLDPALGY